MSCRMTSVGVRRLILASLATAALVPRGARNLMHSGNGLFPGASAS